MARDLSPTSPLRETVATRAAVRGRQNRPFLTIFQHQVRVLSGRLSLSTALLIVAMMLLAAATARVRYRGELQEREAVLASYERDLANSTVDSVADLLHPAIKSPWRLALVVDGGQAATLDLYRQALNPQILPEIRRVQTRDDRLPRRAPLDWLFVVRYLLPLAAILFGFDAICGEQRAGRLKLLLSYPLPRSRVFAGKLLALWVALALPFLAGAALSLLVAGAGPGRIPFTREDLGKALLVALLGLWAAAFFALAALLVSTLARDAATSLSVLAWLWVLGVIVGPAVSGLLAHRLLPVLSQVELEQRLQGIDREIAETYAGREGQWRRPAEAAADDFAWERVSARVEDRRFARKDEVRRQVLARQIAQARLARQLASFSPVSLLSDLAERLTGAGLDRDESFLVQARGFRVRLAERVRALDAADPASPHLVFFKDYLSQRPLPPGALPRFAFAEPPFALDWKAARRPLALFALETAALALGGLFLFSRYDASDP